jgi:hypothetical protein
MVRVVIVSDLTIQCEKVEGVSPCELPDCKTGMQFDLTGVTQDSAYSIIQQITNEFDLGFTINAATNAAKESV